MRFGYGELHLVLLALLSERPMHGYELMSELGRRVRRYKPSPGSIYPAMQALEGEGLISASEDDDRRVYALTPDGRRALVKRGDRLAALESRLGLRLSLGLEPALARFAERVRAVSTHVTEADVERLLDKTAAEIEAAAKRERGT